MEPAQFTLVTLPVPCGDTEATLLAASSPTAPRRTWAWQPSVPGQLLCPAWGGAMQLCLRWAGVGWGGGDQEDRDHS